MNRNLWKKRLAAGVLTGLLAIQAGAVTALAQTRTYNDQDSIVSGIGLENWNRVATLTITYPNKDITTTDANYYITGMSNPLSSTALTVNGTPVEAVGKGGSFGYYAALEMGANTFTFAQDGITKSVTITRVSPSASSGVGSTTVITKPSPAMNSYAKEGQVYKLTCIAPAGATVTASVNGKTVKMTQNVPGAQTGVPANFTGEFTYTTDDHTNTRNIGKVTYTLQYQGNTTTYTSSGSLYGAGANTTPVAEMKLSSVNRFATSGGSFTGVRILSGKGRDYITDQTDAMLQLSEGGWVQKSDVNIMEGDPWATSRVSQVTLAQDDTKDEYTLQGACWPVFATTMTDETFTITFHDTKGFTTLPVKTSSMISAFKVTVSEAGDTTISFTKRNPDSIWGYDVTYLEDGSAVLTLRKKPKIDANADKPLTGVKVALDPGHGGTDGGAVGISQGASAIEKDMTLATALATKKRLESLGAEVVLTRSDDSALDLTPRQDIAKAANADIFLAIHINSMPTTANGAKTRGVEVYYHDGLAKEYAAAVAEEISNATGRLNRGGKFSNYKVTMYTYAPSILAELGFICNPAEYDDMCSADGIFKTANALSEGIIRALA